MKRFVRAALIRPVRLRLLWLSTGEESVVCEVNGSEMELDVRPGSPREIEHELAVDGIREPGATETFRRVLADLEVGSNSTVHVFDVGANVGYFVLLEAEVLGERGRVYAVEAEPTNVGRLERNVERNGYTGVEVRQIAAGAERNRLELSLESTSNLHRMSEVLGGGDAGDTLDVEVYPLDDLVDEYGIPDDEVIVVRMDVEGYEERVFEGMSRLLASDRPVYLFAEIHGFVGSVDAAGIAETLAGSGFTPEYISFDGGNTVRQMGSLDELKGVTANTHVMASRRTPGGTPGRG